MPRPSPFTKKDIEQRREFGFASIEAARVDAPQKKPRNSSLAAGAAAKTEKFCHERFRKTVQGLKLDKGAAQRCERDIAEICRLYYLEQTVERQESPGRKAYALRVSRWSGKWREKQKWVNVRAHNPHLGFLPPALEQEAARLSNGSLPNRECFETLQKRYEARAKRGRPQSLALLHTVQRLQILASQYEDGFAWRGRNCPRELIEFIRSGLKAAGIPHPNEDNPAQLRKLMVPRGMTSDRNVPLATVR